MSTLFSSPSKQAKDTVNAELPIMQGLIGDPGPIEVPKAGGGSTTVPQQGSGLEGYTATGQKALRTAIENTGPNPYFSAAEKMDPSGYAVNPQNTAAFGATPAPGNFSGAGTANNAFAPGAGSGPPRSTMPIQRAGPPSGPPTPPPTQQLPPQNPPGGGRRFFGPELS